MAATKKTTTKKGTKSTAKKPTAAEISSRRQLYAIGFFALGIIFLAMTLIKGENLWQSMHYALFGLFGWCAYLIGPVFIYLAVMNTMEKPTFSTSAQGYESLALIILLSGITTVFSENMVLDGSVFQKIGQLYTYGKELTGGGVLSSVYGLTAMALMGRLAAIIVGLVLIVVDLMLLTGTTLIGIARDTKKVGDKVKTVYTEQVEHHKAAMETRRMSQIDIPLDDGPKFVSKETEDSVKRSKEKLLGTTGAPVPPVSKIPPVDAKPAQAPAEKIIDIPLDCEPSVPVTTVKQDKPVITAVREEPINGFKPHMEVEVPDMEKIEEIKPAKEQMAEAAEKDPNLEELISKAMVDQANAKKIEKAELKVLADEQEKKITEIMNDLETIPYVFPPTDLLKMRDNDNGDITEELRKNADTLTNTLQSFGVTARVIDINRGPAVTRYELQPGAGVKVSKIANLSDDLALNLAAKSVRIEAPIPGKAAVGVEVPNKNRDIVNMRELIESREFQEAKSKLTVALGRDIVGNIVLADLKEMPHLLVAGSTGSGKSVCINTMIISLLYKSSPDEVKLLLIDPKVVELSVYNGIPHLLIPVVTDPRKAAGALNWAVSEMLKRYQMFADNAVRDIDGYNKLADSRDDMQRMPKVVIIIDELADLMLVASSEVEDAINRLAALARAAGMHLVVATQRPSVDVITGVIKSNIGSRIAFKTSSQVDSRTILPDGSAEKLLGKGDMLFYPQTDMRRVQGCFVSDSEVEEVVRFVKNGGTASYDEGILDDIEKLAVRDKSKKSSDDYSSEGGGFDDGDDMLDAAIECVIEMGMASTSMLQRKLKLGYARAARIIDQMEERGIVGPFEGSKPRQVLISKEQWLEKQLQSDE
ncbi:MAG: DNA translocase FtsK [Oscillospiraceae bacterium]|nr:DNA translocase FtsK [Oscillospiraceae bacterium]